MKKLSYLFALSAIIVCAHQLSAADMKTVSIMNKSPLELYVMPGMTMTTLSSISANRPMAGIIPPNGMGAQFSYPKQLWGVYILTPTALATYKKDNPSAGLDTKQIFGWIVSKQKQAKDGVYTSTPSANIIITDGGNGQLIISTQ